MRRGFFIVIDGPEGGGKTTQTRILAQKLKKQGYKIILTREPGGTKISEETRRILLDPKNKVMDKVTELFLYLAARNQIIKEIILPALKRKMIVICDRFFPSTFVYQYYTRGLNLKLINFLNKIVTQGLTPDLTFILDVEPKTGFERLDQRKRKLDRFEKENLKFHQKIRKGYLEFIKRNPSVIKIDTNLMSIKEINRKILEIVIKKLKRK